MKTLSKYMYKNKLKEFKRQQQYTQRIENIIIAYIRLHPKIPTQRKNVIDRLKIIYKHVQEDPFKRIFTGGVQNLFLQMA